MAREKNYPTLSEIYRRAWESCRALWPLLIVRFVFVVVNFGAIFLCLFLVCWPFIQTLWKVFKDSEGGNFANVLKEADFSGFTPDAHWIFMAAGMFLLFITWWGLLEALFDGAVYARVRDNQENGSSFSLAEFFKDGMRYMGPMIGLQICWFLILMGLLLAGGLLAVLIVVFFKALSISPWFGLLLAIPGGFASFALLIWLAGFGAMGGAYLMEGQGVLNALQKSFHKCLEGYARVVWGIFLVWVIYAVFSIAFQTVMGILGHIPLLGILFILFEFLVSMALSILIWVFMPALAVAFSLEKES